MKVNSITSADIADSRAKQENSKKQSFKSGALLNATANLMQGIEKQGYFLSFLIQDGIGMTAPRTWTGFQRDKEITGKWNFQEGKEVFLREGMTGPYIIGVAPAFLWLTTKFCKSTNTNTRLIKRFGDSLKSMIKDSAFDKTVQRSKEAFKNAYIKYNIENIYKNSVPNDLKAEETISLILKEMENLYSKDKKIKNSAIGNIVKLVNEKITQTSPDLYNLNKLVVGEGKNKKLFNTAEVIKALKDFTDDAIINNSQSELIDEIAAENIKNNFATKRILTNVSNIALTLGGLSIIPKISAKSDIAPGAQVLQHIQNKENEKTDEIDSSAVSFKGRGINSGGIFSGFGKLLTKYNSFLEKAQELIEYTGINFTKTTFACLSLFGLLLPRGKRAWDRAQIDENGKRDMTEINEILLRDTVSSLSVVFAVPILTKVIVNAYEKSLGFILTNRANETEPNGFKRFLNVINPYSKLEVLSLSDLDAVYGNIDSKSKLINFANFVDKNGGDLEKILSKSDNVKEMFNESSFTLESIKDLAKKDKNNKIISFFKEIKSENPNAKHELIEKVMKGAGDIKKNGIAKAARGLNSFPNFISTFIISPVILGVLIPKLTYYNTRKTHEKMIQGQNNN